MIYSVCLKDNLKGLLCIWIILSKLIKNFVLIASSILQVKHFTAQKYKIITLKTKIDGQFIVRFCYKSHR